MKTSIQTPPTAIALAVDLLAGGNLVAFPTETVYGLGADARQAAAIELVYRVKGRPANNPLIVHVADTQTARQCAGEFPPTADILAAAFWPGPLTMVLPRGPTICPAACAGLNTMAIRVPNHPIALEILARFGHPVCAPSANLSGHTSPTSAGHVLTELDGLIPLIVDGGSCTIGLESTVVDLTGPLPVVLRPGAITAEMIQRELLNAGLNSRVLLEAPINPADPGEAMASPGLLARHYAPRTPAFRFTRTQTDHVNQWLQRQPGESRIVLLTFPDGPSFEKISEHLILPAGGAACAQQLYAMLRKADEGHFDTILLEMPELQTGVWAAIVDRMTRATQELA